MSDVKWVKLTTTMFDNRKIKHLRRLPEGNSIVLIWVMLLTMAGRCNAGGMIFLTENIPYTTKMLADELDFEESTVVLALNALERLNMIVTENGFFSISGWEEYQNVEKLDKIREQTRKRVSEHREKQRIASCNVTCNANVTQCNVTCNADVTQCNATDIDIDKDIDIDIDINKEKYKEKGNNRKTASRFTPPTLEEVQSYCRERKNDVDAQRFIDYYSSNGWMVGKNKMKDWKAAVRTWERNNFGSAPASGKKYGTNGIAIDESKTDLDDLFGRS